jgi:PAS domain-containing protein
MRQTIWHTCRQFLWSVIIIGLALGATELLYHIEKPLQQRGNFVFFLAAVAIAAWRGGTVPAIFTTILATLVIAWLMPPSNSLHVSSHEDIVRLTLFVFIAALISYLHYARERAESSLQESERRLHFSLDSSGVACWDANIAKGTFWKSHNLAGIFGRSDSEFATTYEGFFAYVYPEDREFFHLATVGGGAHHRDFEIAHRIICGDESIRRVSTRGRMYLDEEGRVERMVGAVFAIDEKSRVRTAASEQKTGDPDGTATAYLST